MKATSFLLRGLIGVGVSLAGMNYGSCIDGSGERIACPEAVAHRAGGIEVGEPEHSRAALDRAVADGVSVIELDLQASSDGVPFLVHGKHLKQHQYILPPGAARVKVENLSAQELREVCHRAAPSNCLIDASEGFSALKASHADLLLDPKESNGSSPILTALRLAERARVHERLIVLCSPANECSGISNRVRVMYRVSTAQELRRVLPHKPYAVQVDEELLDSPEAAAARARGVKLMVKTLDELGDEPEHWRKLRERGVDWILTDFPRLLGQSICREYRE